jgi:hydrogenase maturation protease
MTCKERQPIVIIAIGNTLRRDDGVGPLVLDACRYEPIPGCDLVELDGDSTRVIEAWRDRDLAIVVDAVCTGSEAGTVHDLTIDELADVQAAATATSSHFAGLAEALALGRTLDRLPGTLRVLGIEPGDLKHGFGLSPAVAASMEDLEARVRAAAIGSS